MDQNVCKTPGQKRSIEDTVPSPNESNKDESSGSDHVRAPNPLRRRNSLTDIPSLTNQQDLTISHQGKTFNLNQIVQPAVCTQPVLDYIAVAIKSTLAEALKPVSDQLQTRRQEIQTLKTDILSKANAQYVVIENTRIRKQYT